MKNESDFTNLLMLLDRTVSKKEELAKITGSIKINKSDTEIINIISFFKEKSDNLSDEDNPIRIIHVNDFYEQDLIDSDKDFTITFTKKGIKKYFDITYYQTIDIFLQENPFKLPDGIFYLSDFNFLSCKQQNNGSNFYNSLTLTYSLVNIFQDLSYEKKELGKELKLLFINLSEKKWINVKYKSLIEEKYVIKIEQLRKLIYNESSYKLEFSLIVKSNIISFLNQHHSDSFEIFLQNFGEFYDNIIRDYQIFISNLSFNNIYKDFEKQKNEYIRNFDDQLRNISKEILSIPIAAGVTILIQYLKQNELVYSIIFLISFLIYSIIQSLIIKNNLKYLNYLLDKLKQDEKECKDKDVYNYFEKDFKMLHSKSSLIKCSSNIIIAMFIVINIALIIFVLYQTGLLSSFFSFIKNIIEVIFFIIKNL